MSEVRYRPGGEVSFGALGCVVLAVGFRRSLRRCLSRLLVFDFELLDTSLEGEIKGINDDEQERLKLISDLCARCLDESDATVLSTCPDRGRNRKRWQLAGLQRLRCIARSKAWRNILRDRRGPESQQSHLEHQCLFSRQARPARSCRLPVPTFAATRTSPGAGACPGWCATGC